jgi:phage terminase large subunit
MGRNVQIVPNMNVEQGIKAARQTFAQCFFDEFRTERLVECLRRYRRNIPVTTDEPATPCHDEFSHGADAFRYMSIVAGKLSTEDWGEIEYDNRGII